MKVTPKEQMKIGRKIKEMKRNGYSEKEIIMLIQKLSATEFIEFEVKKKES